MSLAERRRCVAYLVSSYQVSERRACQAMQLHRSSYRYEARHEAVDATHRQVVALSQRYPYWGYRKMYDLMREQGTAVSGERVRTIRRNEGLQVRTKARRRRALGQSTTWVHRALHPGHVWSYDFVFNQSEDGRQLKCLTVVDEFTRRGLDIVVGRSLTALNAIRILEGSFHRYGPPVCIRSDNGPELVSKKVQSWLNERDVETHYIAPGSPWESAYNESFNSIFRITWLQRWLFGSMAEARAIIRQWLDEYNTIRLHGSLNGMNPQAFEQNWWQHNVAPQQKTLTL
ncbi:MAG: IS3 family transposase [Pseudomonadota bacterium]